jgi:hypothetical protein
MIPDPTPDDPRTGDPTRISTWVGIGGVIITVIVIITVTRWNGGGGPRRATSTSTGPTASSVTSPATSASPVTAGSCNPGDVRLTVHLYGHIDIGMTYDDSSGAGQTSWPAGNAPFPNSFPHYPAPWLRYGCFHPGTTVHLTFHNADEPWLQYSRTATGECNRTTGPLKVGQTADQLSAPATCNVGLQNADVELTAYWAEPSFVNGVLTAFAEYPACLPGGTPGYCPPAGS